MNEIFEEVHRLFPDEYIHLGMDEVYYDCWKSNPNITNFMKQNGMSNINEIEQYYVRKTLKNVRDIGYKYMTWQDPVDNGVVVSLFLCIFLFFNLIYINSFLHFLNSSWLMMQSCKFGKIQVLFQRLVRGKSTSLRL